MMDDIIVRTMMFLFFSFYLFQMVMEVVYQNHYGDTEDEDEDNDDTDDGDSQVEDSNNCNDSKVVTVTYEDKYLIKVRNTKQFKEEPLNIPHLKNNFVMEYTPVGNVLMYYNGVKECFDYYSDSTIPYRYLEVVARKYVLMNNCVSLYFDMEEELARCVRDVEKRKEDGIDLKEEDENGEKDRIDSKEDFKDLKKDLKKSVFAKFKSYNKEGGTGHVNTAAPPKNNISQINVNVNVKANNSENVCLKEHANRYSHQGKILNFSMLQKVDRTKVDKKFAMTYADFKRLKNMERIYDKEDKDKETEDKEEE